MDDRNNPSLRKPTEVKPVGPYREYTGNPQLGARRKLRPSPLGSDDNQVFDVRVRDDYPLVHTVVIDADLRNTLIDEQGQVPSFGGPVTALLEWKTGVGNQHKAVIDVLRGIEFSLMATEVRCSMLNEAYLNPTLTNQQFVEGWGSIGQWPIARISKLTKTVHAADGVAGPFGGLIDTAIASGASIVLPWEDARPDFLLMSIPPYSKSLDVLRDAGGTGAGPVRVFFFHNGVIIASRDLGPEINEDLEIPGATTAIQIQNMDAGPQHITPVFTLAI